MKATSAVINRAEIGRAIVQNVQAFIPPDHSLDDTLLAMSFPGEMANYFCISEIKHRFVLLALC